MEVITQEIKATEVHGQATRDKTQCTQGTEKPDGLQTVPHSHLVGKESTCNAGDPSSIPGSGKSAAEGIGYPLQYSFFFPCGSAGKESAYNVGPEFSPWLGKSPGEGKGYLLQYSGLENSMNYTVHGVAELDTIE